MSNLCPQCGAPVQANATKCEYCGAAIAQPQQQAAPQPQPQQQQQYYAQQPFVDPRANLPVKSKIVAGVLALLLGYFGVHKFYLGQAGLGILYLLFCWTGIPEIVCIIDAIILFCMSDENFQNKYHCRIG